MSCGVAAAGAAAVGKDAPLPLPAQALDHGSGYLLAAAIIRALTRRAQTGEVSAIASSLAGTANVLMSIPTPGGLDVPATEWSTADTQPIHTAWGQALSVPIPDASQGFPPSCQSRPAGSVAMTPPGPDDSEVSAGQWSQPSSSRKSSSTLR
jgi:hypothetical protein